MSADAPPPDADASAPSDGSDASDGAKPSRFRLPSAYTILFGLIVLTALATWFIPAGRYQLDADGSPLPGTYEEVDAPRAFTLRLDDGRPAGTTFEAEGDGTRVRTVFDPEASNPAEMQRDGWQAILDSCAAYVTETRP